MRNHFAKACMIPIFSGLLLAPLMLSAADQHAEAQQGDMVEQQPMAEVDEANLEKFADAYIDVGEIHNEYSQLLQEVEAPEQAQELQQEANDKMVEAIQANDLEVQEYSEIAAAIEQNPEMRERVVGMIEQRQ